MAKASLTPNRKAFLQIRDEFDNLLENNSEWLKKDDIGDEYSLFHDMPARVTQNRLESMRNVLKELNKVVDENKNQTNAENEEETGDLIENDGEYIDSLTGEIFSPDDLEQSSVGRKSVAFDDFKERYIENYKQSIYEFGSALGSVFAEWVDRLINDYGMNAVFEMFMKSPETFQSILNSGDVKDSYTALRVFMSGLVQYLDTTDKEKEEMNDLADAISLESDEMYE